MKVVRRFLRTTLVLILIQSVLQVQCLWCDRAPVGAVAPKTPGDNGFKIVITGDPEKYIPGAVYTVRLQAPEEDFVKFSGFLLIAEPAGGQTPEVASGSFQLAPDSLARFSEYCPHAVKQASELPKTEVQIRWEAPQLPAGCVTFKATISASKSHWYMDDGQLSKELCPESEDGEDENESSSDPCCACDEAKYEMTFEGLWSALTHPKDFPADTLSAHFGDVIGASHSPTYKFWEYGGEASEGLRNLAELGDTQELESELKEKSTSIRTIIKARGLKNPMFYGYKTSAVFRVDSDNHLVSLVSKIVPSPDWFVGVSGVNLCQRNCSWKDEKIVNLYPWDAGTNDGISYTSEGDASYPRENIQRIVWNSDENSPFYDSEGNIVKPFAKLRLVKQRSYAKECDHSDLRRADIFASDIAQNEMYDEAMHQNIPECQVSLWSDWSPCPVTCGRGTQRRYRNYINPAKAVKVACNRRRIEQKNCYNTAGCTDSSLARYGNAFGRSHGAPTRSPYPTMGTVGYCATTDWSQWSQCSATCGRGRRTRERQFMSPLAYEATCNINLQEHEICYGAIRDCSAVEKIEPGCETTQWSEWGPCSVTCGKGVKSRTRLFTNLRVDHRHCNLEMTEYQTCTGVKPDCSAPEDMREICTLPKEPGSCPNSGNLTRWYFDSHALTCQSFQYFFCKGNKNNFRTESDCESQCGFLRTELTDQGRTLGGMPIKCEVSEWSEWSRCRGNCGIKTRYVIKYNFNGGKACPSLEKSKPCDETSPACRAELLQRDVYGRPYPYSWSWNNEG